MSKETLRAYSVHFFTASGVAIAMWALIAIYQHQLQLALWLLALAAVIDSIDGTLARKFNTGDLADKFDGTRLDNIIDYVTWTVLPLFWGFVALNLPIWILALCATASVLGFSNKNAKTDDLFFLGFPSYWNIVILYCYFLELTPVTTCLILLFCAILVFVPIKYIYPSRTPHYQNLTIALGIIFIFQVAGLLYYYNQAPYWLIYSSLIFPVYYVSLSIYLTIFQINKSKN